MSLSMGFYHRELQPGKTCPGRIDLVELRAEPTPDRRFPKLVGRLQCVMCKEDWTFREGA